MEISGNLAADGEFTNSQGIVSESVEEKSCQGKLFIASFTFVVTSVFCRLFQATLCFLF